MSVHPIFQDCCASGEHLSRYSQATPWVRAGYRWATNGSICVRQRTADPDSPLPDGADFPDVASLKWDRSLYKGEPLILPAIPDVPVMEKCTDCQGTGKLTMCPECCGYGDTYEKSGKQQYCEPCKGTGRIKPKPGAEACPDCNGTGTYDKPVPMLVGADIISSKYIRTVIRHGASLYRRKGRFPTPLWLQCGDIEGMVMPINPDRSLPETAEEYIRLCEIPVPEPTP